MIKLDIVGHVPIIDKHVTPFSYIDDYWLRKIKHSADFFVFYLSTIIHTTKILTGNFRACICSCDRHSNFYVGDSDYFKYLAHGTQKHFPALKKRIQHVHGAVTSFSWDFYKTLTRDSRQISRPTINNIK